MSFHVNYDDLQRMLGHIKIAERHVQSGYGVLTDEQGNPLHNLMPYGLRTVSGQYNNLVNTDYGASGGLMPRLLAADFQPAGTDPRTGLGTSYAQTSGSVYDSAPRTISNLVSDQSVDNPAAFVAAFTALGSSDPYGDAARYASARKAADDASAHLQELLDAIGSGAGAQPDPADVAAAQALADSTAASLQALPVQLGLDFDVNDRTLFIPNVMPDLGDTAPFNGFLTLFGQFFDHGLDLVSKGGSGTVYVPLQPDDPLYVAGSPTNFMVLTRATNQPGADGIVGTADDVREHRNETTPFIDLNQVYTSHESHQVFLREYARVEIDGVMRTVATGHMLEGEHGGPPTWADIKQQAREMLGIELTDMDVHRVPLVATDLYGNFQPGANGFAQLVTPGGLLPGDAAAPASAGLAYGAGRACLNDIAHSAAPSDATAYDSELLDQHFIVGDGRGNENIGLTAVHHVFHSEHNHRVEQIKEEILASGDVAFINEWLLAPLEGGAPAEGGDLLWNGERLFQAARFSTEMVYQHLVFEEFARLVSPDIDPFVFSNTVDIDPAIVAEFAHVVYRFGHSMLRETVERLGADGQTADDIGLIQAFLNPQEFVASGADADAAAGAIIRGMSRQVGSEIDEFLTEALRNNLVGLPLDLGALNIARGRDVGVPSLNEARRQFFEQTNDSALRAYDSWYDFALAMKNPASLINFIAAYGTHGTITGATTMEAKRAAAGALVLGGSGAPA
ncbi:MAG: heme peroxidase, partial [Frateuria sp.]|nr:heme peroxidase [Frateuria sp.]